MNKSTVAKRQMNCNARTDVFLRGDIERAAMQRDDFIGDRKSDGLNRAALNSP